MKPFYDPKVSYEENETIYPGQTDDYFAYMKLGVDAVQSATGAMWNPGLAQDIRERITS